MEKRLEGKVAVVTGSSRGIGEGIARRLAAEGAAVVVSGRNAQEGSRVVTSIREAGGKAVWAVADVAKVEDCRNLIQFAVGQFGQLDILVNNAAHMGDYDMETMTPEQWDEVFAANARGTFLCSQAAIPHLRKRGGGSIVNIGTTMALRGSADRIAYTCSKAAVLALTNTMARVLAKDQIRVNWVIVGWVMSPREVEYRDRLVGDGRAYMEKRSKEMPMGRMETEEDIAAGVAFLVCDDAVHVSACHLNISGGLFI